MFFFVLLRKGVLFALKIKVEVKLVTQFTNEENCVIGDSRLAYVMKRKETVKTAISSHVKGMTVVSDTLLCYSAKGSTSRANRIRNRIGQDI